MGVRELHITSRSQQMQPVATLSVTDPTKAGRIIRWFDALGIVQPGAYSCPVRGGHTVSIEFLGADGAVLARASGIDFQGTSGPCNPIQFSIGGHAQRPLLGGRFFANVGRLIGARLDSGRRS